jgi:hypothetical protein
MLLACKTPEAEPENRLNVSGLGLAGMSNVGTVVEPTDELLDRGFEIFLYHDPREVGDKELIRELFLSMQQREPLPVVRVK